MKVLMAFVAVALLATAEPVRPRLLRLNEVSELTGVPEATLRYWRHTRTGPPSAKLGRRIVYRERDLEQWIELQFSDSQDAADNARASYGQAHFRDSSPRGAA